MLDYSGDMKFVMASSAPNFLLLVQEVNKKSNFQEIFAHHYDIYLNYTSFCQTIVGKLLAIRIKAFGVLAKIVIFLSL